MGARQQRQADRVGVLLQHGLGDLLGRLVEPGVDHLEPVVAQRPRDRLRTAVVPVEPRLGHDDAVRPLHEVWTLCHAGRAQPTNSTAPIGAGDRTRRHGTMSPCARHNDGRASDQLRSPVARAVVPVLAGPRLIAVIGLFTWAMAAYISRGGGERRASGSRRARSGSARSSRSPRRSRARPAVVPRAEHHDRRAVDRRRTTPAIDSAGWRVYWAYPADRDRIVRRRVRCGRPRRSPTATAARST